MKHWGLWLLIGIFWGCAEKKTDFSGNTPIKINDFNKAFKVKSLPINIADTNLKSLADTLTIGRKALAQFVPDSVVDLIIPNSNVKAKIFPLIKIEKETEYYLLFDVRHPSKDEIVVVIFSKKNKYLDFKVITDFLLSNQGSHNYGKSINIILSIDQYPFVYKKQYSNNEIIHNITSHIKNNASNLSSFINIPHNKWK